MKRYFIISSLFLLTACVSGKAQGIASAAGEKPDYYPGLEQGVYDFARPQWEQWHTENMSNIIEIGQKVKSMREGKLTPRCIGSDTFTCVATLAQTLAMSDYYPISDLFKKEKTDVNGKAIPKEAISITGYIPENKDMSHGIRFIFRLNKNGKISTIEASLPSNPFFAKTQEEYDRTGAYEVISALSKASCPNLSRNDVARFIENSVKPKAKFQKEETTYYYGITTGNSKMAKVKYCGITIQFDSVFGHSTESVTLENPHGSFGGMMITVK